MIGPLPPPMTGLSKALDSILRSPVCAEQFEFTVLDLSQLYTVSGGGLTFEKIAGLFKLIRQTRKLAKSGSVDVFYLTNAQSTVGAVRDLFILHILGREKKKRNYKILVHLHGGSFHRLYLRSNPVLQLLMRKKYACVDRAVVLGEALKDMFKGLVPDSRVSVIPNCVDDEVLPDDSVLAEKITSFESGRTLRVLYLSNMIPEKGYPDVLDAAELCLKQGRDISFVFAGAFYSEKEKAEFQNRVDELNREFSSCGSEAAPAKLAGGGVASPVTAGCADNISENRESTDSTGSSDNTNSTGSMETALPFPPIRYLGAVTGAEKKKLLSESDLFVLPTYYPHEGQPITIIEAMSAGMPVICTDHAGISDLISDPENGCFVPARSPEKIAEKICALGCDRKRMQAMAQNNREKVMAQFREKNYIDRIVELFSAAAGDRFPAKTTQ